MSTKMDWRRVAFQGKRTLDHRREFKFRDRADRWLFGCFRRQRSAEQRGVPFEMTFEEWLGIWRSSGRLHQRGTARGSYQMGRIGDVGPYCSSNVSIISQQENMRQAAENKRRRLTAAST
jgi:hypothetical protein